MSKVRREKHKNLVFNELLVKHLCRIHFCDKDPRWRQITKANIKYLIWELRK